MKSFFATVFILATHFSAQAKPLTRQTPEINDIDAETEIASRFVTGPAILKKISATQSLVMTREFGRGTYNTVTIWLKDGDGKNKKYF
ncbi:MAG: hypothetical protein H7328_06530 [Bdellovibrio sp.]|nr:hypothetical protein [Bdellovibrio sp.]